MSTRDIPQDIQAEQCVLGCMMLDAEALMIALEALDASMFYREAHGTIFEACKGIAERGAHCDIITLPSALAASGELEQIGGGEYVMHLAAQPGSWRAIESYCEAVKSCHVRREIIRAASDMMEIASGGATADEALSAAESKVYAIGDKRQTGKLVPMRKTIANMVLSIGRRKRNPELVQAVPTGIPKFDAILGGWPIGQLSVLAARPSMGKTSFAMFCAAQAARAGYGTCVFSIEMGRQHLDENLLALESRINSRSIRLPQTLRDSDEERLGDVAARMAEWPLAIDDSAHLRPLDVLFRVRRFTEFKPRLVIVDYLQNMTPPHPSHGERYVDEKGRVFATVKAMKAHCKDMPDCAVVVLAQLNRQAEGIRPQLHHLAECGKIEQEADLVAFLWREDREDLTACETEGFVAKTRLGPTGAWWMRYDRAIGSFEQIAKEAE